MSQLRVIYGAKDFAANQARLLVKYGVTKFTKAGLMTTPRQFGKTTGMAMFAAAAARNIPGWSMTVFSPTKRQSDNMRDIALDFACSFPDGRERTNKRGEKLFVFSGVAAAARAKGRKNKTKESKMAGKTVIGTPVRTFDGSKTPAQVSADDESLQTLAKSRLEFLPSNEHGRVLFVWSCVYLKFP
jgi:hypothetical protein